MNFSDDIRHYEYDPFLWEKIKNKNVALKEKVEKKKEKLIEKLEKKPKEPKVEKVKIQKEKLDRNERRKKNYEQNREHYLSTGKKWYHENKERLKELRKIRDENKTKAQKATKYLYNRAYYEQNKDELNKKRREKEKLKRLAEKNI
jgi:hypothetical protein